MGEIREPMKKSSIEKKNRIIKKGFELMCKRGYYNVSCVDIAKYSNVSTGIIYQYFNDKRDIFIEGVKDYSNTIMFPMLNIIETKKINMNNLDELLDNMIESFIKTHTLDKDAHEQLMAMSHLDKEIASIFNAEELQMTDKIYDLLINNSNDKENLKECIHIAINIVDSFCHEVVYHKHKELDYSEMKKEVIKTIEILISK